MTYHYSDTDIRSTPRMYMYSEYRGADFMRDYIENRLQAIENIQMQSHRARDNQLDDIAKAFWRWSTAFGIQTIFTRRTLHSPGEHSVRTLDILIECLYAYINNDKSNTQNANHWTDTFLRKFEAGKRLHDSYDKALQPHGPHSAGYRAYVTLAALLTMRLSLAMQLRDLNALLKLNDLLINNLTRLDPTSIYITRVTLEKELNYVRHLAAGKHVKFPIGTLHDTT